ncbi:MAG: SDR family oxidoreductase [Planctomycetota bacterium]
MPSETFPHVAKTALITGSSRGLGKAAATRLAADGFRVAIHYARNQQAAEAVAQEISGSTVVGGDLSSLAGIDAMFEQLDAAWGHDGQPYLGVLVNNAGVNAEVTFADTTEEQFDRLYNLNVKGAFFTAQRAAQRMLDGGRIINLSTGLTRFSMPQYTAYASTKGAIDVFTQHLAKDLGRRGITVNSIAPGATETDMNEWLNDPQVQAHISGLTALGRPGRPDDIADAIAFLASDDSRWVTGQRIEASGGMNL